MSYDQREKAWQAAFFGADKGGGQFGNKCYAFVLQDAFRLQNLYSNIAGEVADYFKCAAIDWWRGQNGLPTNLMIATQIACLNHLYWLNDQPEAADAFLKKLDSSLSIVPFANGRYLEFEYNGCDDQAQISFLQEKSVRRGPGSTSFSVAMLARKNDQKILVAIEWRYCEKYYQKAAGADEDDPIYVGRRERWRSWLTREDCVLKLDRVKDNGDCAYEQAYQKFSVEPFYQMMVQTLLAWQLAEAQCEGATDYLYVQVIPTENRLLLQGETSREITVGMADISAGWQQMLKSPEKYQRHDPQVLVADLLEKYQPDLADYLARRYWCRTE